MKQIWKKIEKLPKKTAIIVVLSAFLSVFGEEPQNLVQVSGVRYAQDISDEIRLHIVTTRYKFHLRRITPPTEPVIVRVSIDRFGNTTAPEILSPDTLSAVSREIILQDLETWKFAQIRYDGESIASFPLNLRNRLN